MKKNILYTATLGLVLFLTACNDEQTNNTANAKNLLEQSNTEFGLKDAPSENDSIQKDEEEQSDNVKDSTVEHYKDEEGQSNSVKDSTDEQYKDEDISSDNTDVNQNVQTMHESTSTTHTQATKTLDATVQEKSGCQVYNPITGGCED